jgi:meiotically up-regulated gene 157 (Mug157) protein
MVLALLALSSGGPAAATETAFPPLLSSKLDTLYATAYDETIGRHVKSQRDGTTYVSTGDIRAEWLRDASAIVRHPHRSLRERVFR